MMLAALDGRKAILFHGCLLLNGEGEGILLTGESEIGKSTTFRRWKAASELPRCPLLPETLRDAALTLILRLRAETAFHLGHCEEVRTIAARLGHRYEHLENLLKQIDR